MRNLITFSIVLTNKNGMDRFNPAPIKKAQSQHPNKTKVKGEFYPGLFSRSDPDLGFLDLFRLMSKFPCFAMFSISPSNAFF